MISNFCLFNLCLVVFVCWNGHFYIWSDSKIEYLGSEVARPDSSIL